MRYMSALRNQWQTSYAWLTTTLILGGVCIYLAISLVEQAQKMPVRLIPQEFHSLNGPAVVESDGTGNDLYMTLIALADVKSYTDWTPRTVKGRMARFANRFSPELYAIRGTELLLEAEELGKGERSQAFYEESTEVLDTTVVLTGVLTVWQGKERVAADRVFYTLDYGTNSGVPEIVSFNASRKR